MGRPRKKKEIKISFEQAIEQLKDLQETFDNLYLMETYGKQAISKQAALSLSALNKSIEIRLKTLPNEVQKA